MPRGPRDPLLVLQQLPSMLPVELIQVIDDVYFLHVLATDPAKFIPPGKSLLSMMVHSQLREKTATSESNPTTLLYDKVEEALHRAFWNEVPWKLSAP